MENNGMTFGDWLQLAFIILKLCGVIHWSWLLVLTPLWVTVILAIFFDDWR